MIPLNSLSRRLHGGAITVATTAFLLCGALHAQVDDDDVYVLDPFTVSGGEVRGYQVRNTLSATRFNAIIREVPLTITSLTREFLEDTYSLTLEDSVRFTAGVTQGASSTAEETGGFYIRGLRTLRSKRNGINQLYSQDMTNVERVEVVKGPMSLLYGQVEPGGIVNYLTMRPLEEFRTDVQLTWGSYDHYRAQINHTGPLYAGRDDSRHQVLYRFDASYKRDGGWRENTEDERSFWSGLLQYKPFRRTTVTVQWDYLNQNSFNTSPLPEYNTQWREIFEDLVGGFTEPVQNLGVRVLAGQDPRDSYTLNPPVTFTDAGTGQPYEFYSASSQGNRFWDSYAEFWGRRNNFVPANAFNNVDQHTVSLEVRQQLGEAWASRLYVVHHNIVRRSAWGDIWALGLSGDKAAGYSWNHFKRRNFDFTGQLEITGRWNLGHVENQTFIGLEHMNDNFRGSVATGGGSNIVNPEIADAVADDPFNPITGSTFLVPGRFEIDLNRPLEPQNFQDRKNYSAFISNLSRFLDDRLLILAGIRYDKEESQRVERPGLPLNTSEETTIQLGTSYRLNEQINLYASYSESFRPQNGFVNRIKSDSAIAAELERPPGERVFTDPDPLRPISGTGYEVGAKFDLFDDRLSGSFAFFRVELSGVPKSFSFAVPGAFDDSGNQQTAIVGNQNNGRRVEGFETELFFRPTDNWQWVFTYAFLDSVEILNQNVVEIREGNAVPTNIPSISVPEHQIGLWTKYTFGDGRLDGLSIGGGFNWLDKRYGAFQLRTENPAAASFVGTDDAVEKQILLGSQILFDGMIAYTFRSRDRFEHTIQLNGRNLANRRYVHPGGMPQDPRIVYLTIKSRF
ncbi:MAG: TonB-dependent receptor [Opitutales bacterium]|nr:TonB-dependent receptor [Opitutales bacterium]